MFQQIDITQLEVAPTLAWQESFSAWLYHNDRKQKTIMAYLQDMRHFAEFFQRENNAAFTPEQLNATDVKTYFRAQDADHAIAPASRNRRLATLRVLVKWAVEEGLLDYDPTVSIKRVPVELTPRDRTRDEMDRLNAAVTLNAHIKCKTVNHAWLGQRDTAIWILFNCAGLRIGEVASLQITDLDFAENKINVLGKGEKKAPVPVGENDMREIANWLTARGVESDYVITDLDGTPITSGQIRRRIKMIGQTALVADLKPHDLRHTYAYNISDSFKAQGMPQEAASNALRKQMRHSDEKTTRLYFGPRASQVRAAVDGMNWR